MPIKPLAIATILFAAGCGTTPEPAQKDKALVPVQKAVEYFRPDPATVGTVKGNVVFRGKKPGRTLLTMSSEESCAKAHAGKPVYDEPVITGKNGALANAFVYIQTGLEGKNFEA